MEAPCLPDFFWRWWSGRGEVAFEQMLSLSAGPDLDDSLLSSKSIKLLLTELSLAAEEVYKKHRAKPGLSRISFLRWLDWNNLRVNFFNLYYLLLVKWNKGELNFMLLGWMFAVFCNTIIATLVSLWSGNFSIVIELFFLNKVHPESIHKAALFNILCYSLIQYWRNSFFFSQKFQMN